MANLEAEKMRQDATIVASPKRHKYVQWKPDEIGFMRGHPEMTTAALADALGRSESSVKSARHRFGRFDTGADRLCCCCGERVVYEESPQARRWRLCKGCYLREERMRQEEDKEANRLRQRKFRNRREGA